MFCTQCGTQAAPEANFCRNCGARLGIASPAPQLPQPISVQKDEPQASNITTAKSGPTIAWPQSYELSGYAPVITTVQSAPTGPIGIGGWLLLPAIGLVLGPIRILADLVSVIRIQPTLAAAGYGLVPVVGMAVDFGLLLFVGYAAIRFFGKKSDAPRAYSALLLFIVAGNVLVFLIGVGAAPEVFARELGSALASSMISAAIWLPYFRASKRVKATFVN